MLYEAARAEARVRLVVDAIVRSWPIRMSVSRAKGALTPKPEECFYVARAITDDRLQRR